MSLSASCPQSREGVCTVELIDWDPGGEPPGLLIELPHGATLAEHYERARGALKSPLPDQLDHFFFVNTDVASPECAQAIAHARAQLCPGRGTLILRSLIPRTFIDCNRVLSASDALYREGGVTPGVPPWIQHPEDLALLKARHQTYQEEVQRGLGWVCGTGGRALMLHTYAPRSVGIREIDLQIVEKLHAAYAPGVYSSWPLRPEIDLITTTQAGVSLVDAQLVADLGEALARIGLPVTESQTYPLHPATTAYHHAIRFAPRTLCLEIRRDLVVERFEPFQQMVACPSRIAPIAQAMAHALSRQPDRDAG